MMISLIVILLAVSCSTYYIACKFDQPEEIKYPKDLINAQYIINNKEQFSKLQIQKAQQLMDKQ
jgi:hypothetical protein